MKEEICKRILDDIEHIKWEDILNKEINSNSVFSQFQTTEETEDDKFEYSVKVSETTVYIYKREWFKTSHRKKVGWFKYTTTEKWEEFDYPFDREHTLFDINYEDMAITVYDTRVYEYCKEFGKRFKFNKLYKCWEGVV